MQASEFDEDAFFSAIARSGARALLIGRRAMVVLGLPVLTADYDFWIAGDDIARFNDALRPFDLHPDRTPEEARQLGRYVLENDEHADVLVARERVDGETLEFEATWGRRRAVAFGDVTVVVPAIADLITTKRFAARDKDVADVKLLQGLLTRGGASG